MKKLALILALMLCAAPAFGLEMLDNNTMDSITGQAGVSIAVDDVQIFMNIEKLAWIDCDGFQSWEGKGSCSGNAGAIVLNNFQLDVLNVNAIVGTATNDTQSIIMSDGQYQTNLNTKATNNNGLALYSTTCGKIPLFYDYATSATGDGCYLYATGSASRISGVQNLGLNNYSHYNSLSSSFDNTSFVPHFLTIDVTDRLPASTEGLQYWASNAWTSAAVAAGNANASSTVGGVLIGIPTVEIFIQSMSLTPMYDGDVGGDVSTASNDDDVLDVANNAHTYGTIYMQGITFTPLGGWIEISPK